MAIVVRLQHHHIHLILNLQNENKNKMLNRLSFLSENDDPQKYKGMMEKIDITATGVVDSIRNKMAVATVSNKGLMPSGVLSEFQGAYSVLLFETTSTPVTGSILLSISATSSGMPSLYYISISRAGDVTGNPNLKVKVLSGSYNIKIKAKTEADGKCRVYAERLVYTPILNVLLMSSFGISMKMEAADNGAFEGGFEATFDL